MLMMPRAAALPRPAHHAGIALALVALTLLGCAGEADLPTSHDAAVARDGLETGAPGLDGAPGAEAAPAGDGTSAGDAAPVSDAKPSKPDAAPTPPDAAPKPDAPSPFTADGCFKWPSSLSPSTTLHAAVAAHTCVEVQAGTFSIDKPVPLKPGRTLRGLGQTTSILKANHAAWSFGCCDAMVTDTLPANPAVNPFKVSKLGLDGAGVATYNVCCRGYTVEYSTLRNSRCSAIGAAGAGVTARHNEMLSSAQPTQVPGKGTISCATGGFGGVAEGAAIYSEGKASDYGTLIESNVIKGSFGPALDINGAWGGTFRKNTVSGNTAWAAVSLYGASNWTIEGNSISHPANQPPQPYHPYCATGPAGGHSAGIFLCQDTDANNLVTNNNKILNNSTSSYYGILSVGADEIKAYWAPRNNTFSGNNVFGSQLGCADDFKPGQWLTDKNVWTNNNCGGGANTPPSYF